MDAVEHLVPPRLFGLRAAARYLGIEPRSVQRLVGQGELRPVRLGVRRVLFDRQDLDRLIRRSR